MRTYKQIVDNTKNDNSIQPKSNSNDELTFEDALVEVDAMYCQAYIENDNERAKILYEVLQRLSKIYEVHYSKKHNN